MTKQQILKFQTYRATDVGKASEKTCINGRKLAGSWGLNLCLD